MTAMPATIDFGPTIDPSDHIASGRDQFVQTDHDHHAGDHAKHNPIEQIVEVVLQ